MMDFVDGVVYVVEQVVDVIGQIVEEVDVVVVGGQVLIEVVFGGGGYDVGYGVFQQEFLGVVVLFYGKVEMLVMCVEYWGDNLGEVYWFDLYMFVMGFVEGVEDVVDVIGVNVEVMNVVVDQMIGIEIGEGFVQVVLLVVQQGDYGLVDVVDYVVVVGDYYCGM